jgi:hypothetical protein
MIRCLPILAVAVWLAAVAGTGLAVATKPAPTPPPPPIIMPPNPADLATAADEARAAAAYESDYGDAVRRVLATRDGYDDISMSSTLLAAARTTGTPTAYRVLLCNKAILLATLDLPGYETAVTVATYLASEVPEKAAACQDAIALMRNRQYEYAAKGPAKVRAGLALDDYLTILAAARSDAGLPEDAIKRCRQALTVAKAINAPSVVDVETQLRTYIEEQRVAARVSSLALSLKSNPDNRTSREQLILVHIVDRDDPAEALKLLDASCDAGLRRYVPAAAKGTEAAPELACQEMATWYQKLSVDAATSYSKLAMLGHAVGYYQRFLDLHTAADADRAAVDLALKKLQADVSKLEESLSGPGWIDCMKVIDPAKDFLSGAWQRTDAGLVAAEDFAARAAIRLVPAGAYDLEVKFVRSHGGMVGLVLPVSDTAVVLALGGAGNTSGGLETVLSQAAGQNPTTVKGGLVDGRAYTVVARVVRLTATTAVITVTVDGKPFLKWTGATKSLTVPLAWTLPAHCPGLVADKAGVTFTSVRLRVINGRAMPVPAAAATPTSASAN